MTALPFGSFSFKTSLRPEEASAALRNAVDQNASWFKKSTSPWIGMVGASRFRIRRNITSHNSFLPILKGRIDLLPGGARITVRLGLATSVLIFFLLFFLISLQLRAFGILALILGGVILWVGWAPEVRKAENMLKEIIPPFEPEILPPEK